ncbi:MAG TPA: hypothetical protein VGH34_05645 [Vicinamibacterales bacterium]
MADTDRALNLRVWSLSTFRTATFVIVIAAAAHLRDSLKPALGLLDTRIGVAAFMLLWALTWYVTRASVRRWGAPFESASPAQQFMTVVVAGGFNGAAVYLLIVSERLFEALPDHAMSLDGLMRVLALSLFGLPVSFSVGMVVGVAFGLFEVLIVGVGSMLFDRIVAPAQDDAALSNASTSE